MLLVIQMLNVLGDIAACFTFHPRYINAQVSKLIFHCIKVNRIFIYIYVQTDQNLQSNIRTLENDHHQYLFLSISLSDPPRSKREIPMIKLAIAKSHYECKEIQGNF